MYGKNKLKMHPKGVQTQNKNKILTCSHRSEPSCYFDVMLLMYATTPVCMLVKLPKLPIKADARMAHSTPMEGRAAEK